MTLACSQIKYLCRDLLEKQLATRQHDQLRFESLQTKLWCFPNILYRFSCRHHGSLESNGVPTCSRCSLIEMRKMGKPPEGNVLLFKVRNMTTISGKNGGRKRKRVGGEETRWVSRSWGEWTARNSQRAGVATDGYSDNDGPWGTRLFVCSVYLVIVTCVHAYK